MQWLLSYYHLLSSYRNYGATNNMPDIENVAQSLSGTAAKTKYLLTFELMQISKKFFSKVMPYNDELYFAHLVGHY